MVHQCVASARLVSVTRSSPDISFGSSVSRREASTMDPVFTQWQDKDLAHVDATLVLSKN